MSRYDKLIIRVEAHRKGPFPFPDLRRYLEIHGRRLARVQGSHAIFRDQAGRAMKSIPIVNGREVRASYVREVVRIIQAEREGAD